jgi:hypothetical protein
MTGLASASLVNAEPAAPPQPARSTPTTKILAIGTIKPGIRFDQVNAALPGEVRETVNFYLAGKVDQWYSLEGGRPGLAFILNMSDVHAAHDMLEQLPMGRAHVMQFELIPIGPLNPLRWLVEKPSRTRPGDDSFNKQ